MASACGEQYCRLLKQIVWASYSNMCFLNNCFIRYPLGSIANDRYASLIVQPWSKCTSWVYNYSVPVIATCKVLTYMCYVFDVNIYLWLWHADVLKFILIYKSMFMWMQINSLLYTRASIKVFLNTYKCVKIIHYIITCVCTFNKVPTKDLTYYRIIIF